MNSKELKIIEERKQEQIKEWFSDYKGPKWFIDYMLDDKSVYEGFEGGLIEQNLTCAIYNKMDTYADDYFDIKHTAQDYIQWRINNIFNNADCSRFIKRWVDKNFKLRDYKKKEAVMAEIKTLEANRLEAIKDAVKGVIGRYVELDDGRYFTVNYDEATNQLQLVSPTNNGGIVEYERTYDDDFSVDINLQALYDIANR